MYQNYFFNSYIDGLELIRRTVTLFFIRLIPFISPLPITYNICFNYLYNII